MSGRKKPKNLITDFLDLRNSSISLAQTGPKKRKGGVNLTPVHPPSSRTRSGHSSQSTESARKGRRRDTGRRSVEGERQGGGVEGEGRRGSHGSAQGEESDPPRTRNRFMELRDSSLSLAQTGPKRRKGYALTPVHTTAHKPKRTPHHSSSATKEQRTPHSSASKGQRTPHSSASKEQRTPHSSASKGQRTPHSSASKEQRTPHSSASKGQRTPHSSASKGLATRATPIKATPTLSPIATSTTKSAVSAMSPITTSALPVATPTSGPHVSVRNPVEGHTHLSGGTPHENLEPLESEGEDWEEEPELATPRIQDMTAVSYHDDGGDGVGDDGNDGDPNDRPIPVKRGRKSSQRVQRTPGIEKSRLQTLPRALIKNLFSLYSKRRLTQGAMDEVLKFSGQYLKQASDDLACYSRHAGRSRITVDDVTLLLRRQRSVSYQRMVSNTRSFEHLVNSYLPMEYAEELLPCVFR